MTYPRRLGGTIRISCRTDGDLRTCTTDSTPDPVGLEALDELSRTAHPIPVLVLMGGGFFIGGDDSRVDDAVLDLEDVRAVSTP